MNNNLQDKGNVRQTFFFSVNRQGTDKHWNYEVLTTGFEDVTGTLEDVKEAITSGYAINGAHFNGDRRKSKNVKKVGLLMLDIDKGLALEDAKNDPFIQRYCAVGYTTASHTDQDPRFRLIFPLPRPLDRDDFEALVKVLSDKLPNDPSCKDAGRVFYGNTKAQFFIDNLQAVLPEDWIDKAIAQAEADRKQKELERRKRWEWRQKNQVFTTDAIPLLTCCSKEVRRLVRNGTAAGAGHNEDALKVLAEVIGVENYFREINQPASDTAKDNYDDFLRNSGVGDHKAETRWNWAEGKDYLPSLSPDKIDSCIKAWKYRQLPPKEQKRFKKEHKFDPPTEPDFLLEEEIEDLIAKNLPESKIRTNLFKIASRHKIPANYVAQIFEAARDEEEKESGREDLTREIKQIFAAGNLSLNLSSFLVPALSKPIEAYAKYLNVKPEVCLSAFLCGISATHNKDTKVKVNSNWEVYPNLWGGVVAPSSQSKTPINRGMIGDPITKHLQASANAEYQEKLEQYKTDKQTYDNLKKEDRLDTFPDGPPTEPKQRAYFTSDLTIEGLFAQAQNQDHGQLIFCDELASLFSGLNQYKSGGNDKQRILVLYDGHLLSITRKDGTVTVKALVSVWGGIQPQVLKKLFDQSDNDADGNWARFLLIEQPPAPMFLNPDGGDVDISGALAGVYQGVSAQPETQFTLSRDAWIALCEANNCNWEPERIKNIGHSIAHFYGKSRGRAVKLAVNLHCANHAASGVPIPSQIEASTMHAAIGLTNFYNAQALSILSQLMTDKRDALPANLSAILRKAADKPDYTVRANEVSNRYKITKTSADAVSLFHELEAMGMGKVSKYRKSILFQASPSALIPEISIGSESTLKFSIDTSIDTKSTPNSKRVNPININTSGYFENSIDTIDTKFSRAPKISSPPLVENSIDTIGVDSVNTSETLDTQGFARCRYGVDRGVDSSIDTNGGVNSSIDTNGGVNTHPNGVDINQGGDLPLPDPLPDDWDKLKQLNDRQIKILGMNEALSKEYLNGRYGKTSRLLLEDSEIYDWVEHCQSLIEARRRKPPA